MQRELCRIARVVVCLPLLVQLAGCASDMPMVGSGPPEICLEVQATQNLNVFEGEPHVVVLYFYPLQTAASFQEADPYDLLNRIELAGQTGKPWETTILPGEQRVIEEMLPRDTALIGIVADFFSGPGKVLIEPGCGPLGGGSVVLSSGDIQVQ